MRHALRDFFACTAVLFLVRLSAAFFWADRPPDSLAGLETWLLSPNDLDRLQRGGLPDFAGAVLLRSLVVALVTVLVLHGPGLASRVRPPVPPEQP